MWSYPLLSTHAPLPSWTHPPLEFLFLSSCKLWVASAAKQHRAAVLPTFSIPLKTCWMMRSCPRTSRKARYVLVGRRVKRSFVSLRAACAVRVSPSWQTVPNLLQKQQFSRCVMLLRMKLRMKNRIVWWRWRILGSGRTRNRLQSSTGVPCVSSCRPSVVCPARWFRAAVLPTCWAHPRICWTMRSYPRTRGRARCVIVARRAGTPTHIHWAACAVLRDPLLPTESICTCLRCRLIFIQ